MKPAVLSTTILGSLALAAMASYAVSPSSPVATSSAASTVVEASPEPPAPARKSVAAVPETGRLPVPIARPPTDQAQVPPAAPQIPLAEPPAPAPPPTVSRDSMPSAEDMPLTDQQLRSALASLPRGPDVRYWIVPLADGRVKVVAGTKGDPGPEGWPDRSARHRRN